MYTKGLKTTIQNSMQFIDKGKIEKIFTEINKQSKDDVPRDQQKQSNDIRKRILLSNHFGTAFKAKNMEEMLFEMKEVQ